MAFNTDSTCQYICIFFPRKQLLLDIILKFLELQQIPTIDSNSSVSLDLMIVTLNTICVLICMEECIQTLCMIIYSKDKCNIYCDYN